MTFLTDAKGRVIERYIYSVEGNVTITDASGKAIADSAVRNRWTYTGREWLSEVGLYDYRNRIYSATLGRFLQPDPIRFRAGDVNMYRYVSNRYLNFTDPSGPVCGNGTWGDWLVPDGVPGIFNAMNACTMHDDLYEDGIYNGYTPYWTGETTIYPGQSFTRSEADYHFRDSMQNSNPGIIGSTFFYIYTGFVRLFGWLFWRGE